MKVVDVEEVKVVMSMRTRMIGCQTLTVIPMEECLNLKGRGKKKKGNNLKMKRREKKQDILTTTAIQMADLKEQSVGEVMQEGKAEVVMMVEVAMMVEEKLVVQLDVHLVHPQPQQHLQQP